MDSTTITPADLQRLDGVYPDSFATAEGAAFALRRTPGSKALVVVAPPGHRALSDFHGQSEAYANGTIALHAPTDAANAQALRRWLPWLRPAPLGLATSAGFGDRLGLATPGHVRALQSVLRAAPGHTIRPIFAQQSIREMSRTRRTPTDVMDDATWGTLEAGWQEPVGADADHLKTTDDIDACAAVGFTFYTIDPGGYVDSEADRADATAIRQKVDALPWPPLESSAADLLRRYGNRTVAVDGQAIALDEASLLRAAAKYGRAVAHVTMMARHLASKGVPYELEISVDETETPTTLAEHVYFASELKRLGVRWVSLAPRFPGRFEKGIDYIGDLDDLAKQLAAHAAIARALGPYKLSLHSGSDKFSVYPLIHAATRGLVHLKTAGTSYVEALRVIAAVRPALFRQMGDFARERYPEDKASYHVSADVARVPRLADVPDDRLAALLDDTDARQVLHVTFGSVLGRFKAELLSTLQAHEEAYSRTLERHFRRHLEPFVA